MDERESHLWQDLNRGAGTRYRAGHAYETRRPAPEARWRPALSGKRQLLTMAAAAVPLLIAGVVLAWGG